MQAIPVGSDLQLSALQMSDQDSLVKYLNDAQIYRQTLRIPFPYSEQDARWFIESTEKASSEPSGPRQLAIRDSAGDLIGVVGFDDLVIGHRAEIGYWLGRPYWGQGIMTRVVEAASRYAEQEWKLVRLTALVFAFNNGSSRVLEKCGYELEGVLRKFNLKDNQFIDAKLYARVR